jgi:hypothetical protein
MIEYTAAVAAIMGEIRPELADYATPEGKAYSIGLNAGLDRALRLLAAVRVQAALDSYDAAVARRIAHEAALRAINEVSESEHRLLDGNR